MLALMKPMLMGTLAALAVSAAWLVVGWLFRRRAAGAACWCGALAVGVGYLAGHAAMLGRPPFPPVEATHRLFYLALAAAAFGTLDSLLPWRGRPRWAAYFLAVVAAQAFVLLTLMRSSWEMGESALWLARLGVLGLVLWAGLGACAVQRPRAILPVTLAALLAGSAALAYLGASALLSQLTALLLVAALPVLAAAFRPGGEVLTRSALVVVGVLLPALWSIGVFFGEVSKEAVVLLAAVPVAVAATAWLMHRLLPRLAPSWPLGLARAALPLVLVSLVVGWVSANLPPPDDEASAYENWSPAPAGTTSGNADRSPAPHSADSPPDDNPFSRITESPSPPP